MTPDDAVKFFNAGLITREAFLKALDINPWFPYKAFTLGSSFTHRQN